jgi:hypothetical protein
VTPCAKQNDFHAGSSALALPQPIAQIQASFLVLFFKKERLA